MAPLAARPLALSLALALASAAAAVRATSAASKLLWSVSDANQVYGSAGVARNRAGATFAVGTDSGSSQYVDVVTSAGKVAFRVTPSAPCNGGCSLFVDQARHSAPADPGAPAVDVFVLEVGAGNCTVMGYVSSGPGATGSPAWTTSIDNCNAGEGTGGTYNCFAATDDGSMAVLQAYHKIGGNRQRAAAYAFDGQSGKLKWDYDLKVEVAGQGDIWVSEPDGAFVAFINEDGDPTPNSAQMHVLLGASGDLRAEVQMPFFIAGDISNDGSYIAIQSERRRRGAQQREAQSAIARARKLTSRSRARAPYPPNLRRLHAPRWQRGLDRECERATARVQARAHTRRSDRAPRRRSSSGAAPSTSSCTA